MSHAPVLSSQQIRQDFLDFFKAKQHTIVSSSSLMPDAPNLLFTNAGMNQFVPVFLGQEPCPYQPGRVADTQKCIRAGGKHNDLEDVGWDTYHHTFFEMLGNWSFGDYFKREAIAWAWELVTEVWGFPRDRIYATVYSPDKAQGDPEKFDQEAYDFWAEIMTKAGLDLKVHIVNGNKKNNFWMMGDTGPCGPCSELHVDLTQQGDTRGALVNKDSSECIEIWNLVFIQFNANGDGTFADLPAKHVDTGMGFERVVSIIQNTQGFRDFGVTISNYETDVFLPIFDEIERMSGKQYRSTLPKIGAASLSEQEQVDVAFRVIGDHIRTLSFAIADGIQPGNTDRNYVLKRILRRAVRYGRTLGFHEPFFYQLVDVLDRSMGAVFPELHTRREHVKDVIRTEEEAFNRTLDRGIDLFNDKVEQLGERKALSGDFAFKLYDTYGFPLDLTALMARERGIAVDTARFDMLMDEQRGRARATQKKEVIEVPQLSTETPTHFCGFDTLDHDGEVLEVVQMKGKTGILLDHSPFYAEMGGQVGDQGTLQQGSANWRVIDTQKVGGVFVHIVSEEIRKLKLGKRLSAHVDERRRRAIERHHTVTHLLQWALHEVVSRDASQKGSYVGPKKLTFDFNGKALTAGQIADVEALVNERILANETVYWFEVDHSEVKGRSDVMQFFGDKYADKVRVVQIGGTDGNLDGFSMELCGGTHTRTTGEIVVFKIVGEAAIAAGIRRVEAIAGGVAWQQAVDDSRLIHRLAGRLNSSVAELERKVEQTLENQKKLEKQLKSLREKAASERSKSLLSFVREIPSAGDRPAVPLITANLGDVDGKTVQSIAESLKAEFSGVIVLGSSSGSSVALVAVVAKEFCSHIQAGKIIQTIAPEVDGKGGGRPEFARGGGKYPAGLDRALAKVEDLFG
ncbi:MAG: Alanine--tRNA ligase [Verrucomicrobia subdivision 3 bacterium]|nr:Alanine--tRNA ligase [Limisphaerales bacterium]MCS1417280.1 Alanine--tRNA ligase [Limisphaerales bacterium]